MHFLNQALVMGFRELQVAGPMMVTMTFFEWVHDPRSLDPVFQEQSVSKDPRLRRDGV